MVKLGPALCAALAGLTLALALAAPASARPYSVDDLLDQEAFGAPVTDPTGRWFVFPRSDPYDTAQRYDNDAYNSAAISRLMVVDLTRPSRARVLLPDAARGQMIVGFSPSGARLAICRYDGRRYTLGVVEMATGAVRWFDDITPEKPFYGRGLQWLSDTEAVFLNRPDGVPTWPLRIGHVSSQRVPALWEATATGAGAHTLFGSGRYTDLRATPTPSQLLRLEVTTGARKVLATGLFLDLEVSPDQTRVALFETGTSIQSRAGEPVQGDRGIETETTRLALVDLRTGTRTDPCGGCDALPHLLTWSPSGRALLVFERTPGAPWTAGDLVRLDAATGRAERVGAGFTPQMLIRPAIVYAGWMGEDPILLARPNGGPEARFDWYRFGPSGPVNLTRQVPPGPWTQTAADAHSLTVVASGWLWRANASGVARRLPGEGAALVRSLLPQGAARLAAMPPAGSWVATGPAGARQLQWVDRHGVRPGPRAPADGQTIAAVSNAPGGSLVAAQRDAHGVQSLQLLRPGQPALSVSEINTSLAEVDATRVVRIPHKGPDGQALTSWLLLPPRAAGSPPPPLIIHPYSGVSYAEPPQDLANERGFVGNDRAFVGHGYAVLIPSLPLPRGRLDPMPGLADRILDIVAAAAATPDAAGAFDPTRLALVGHSYGGYTVQAAISQSDRFAAAISMAGLSDLASKWETLAGVYRAMPEDGAMFNWSTGATEAGQDEMFRPPWEDPARYIRNSPLYAVDRIHTPLMLVHGEQDLIVIQQSDAMFAALYRQKKDAISVTYWGEGHGINSPGNVRDLFKRSFDFLDAHFADPPRGAGPAGPLE